MRTSQLTTVLRHFIQLFLTLAVMVSTSAIEQAILPTIALSGTPYYVDGATGSDSNPGNSRALPWKTIQHASNIVMAGDTVTVIAGTYAERVLVRRSGVAGAPVVFQAEGVVKTQGFAVTADHIWIIGFDISNSAANGDGHGILVEGSHCLIENNYIHFSTDVGISIWAKPGGELTTSHCTIRNNRLYRNAIAGVEVFGSYHIVEGNEVWGTIQHHPSWSSQPQAPDADGITFFGYGHVFRGNQIHDISYRDPENIDPHIDCFQTYNYSQYSPTHDILFENNLCRNLEGISGSAFGKGFMLAAVDNIVIRNNVVQSFAGVVGSGDHLTIVNNTFTSDLSFYSGYGPSGVALRATPHSVIKNNVFFDFSSYSIDAIDGITSQGLDASHNLVFRSDGKTPNGLRYQPDLWQIDPQFANLSNDNFHLHPGSPAVDAGTSVLGVSTDLDGNPRPQGSGYDIGAYEIAAVGITAQPAQAHSTEIVSFTITLTGSGDPATVTDSLPAQLTYMASATTCPGTVTYSDSIRTLTYSGTPEIGLPCSINFSAQVNTTQRIVITNTALIAISPMPPRSVTASVVLNGMSVFLPLVRK